MSPARQARQGIRPGSRSFPFSATIRGTVVDHALPEGRIVSTPTPEQREYAELLLEHATSDLNACRVPMPVEAMRDDVVGFHAQQAVEKP